MTDFIRFPWAVSGDVEAVPATTQPSGDVSIQQGYGEDYSRDIRSDPLAKAVERTKFNGFLNLLTRAVRFLQINGGVPEFITAADNGGSAYSYGQGARVRFSGATYVSLEANNTTEPSDASKWRLIDSISGVANLSIVDGQIASNAAIDASKIGNGSVSNAEYQRLDGVSANIQTQLNGKQAGGDYITQLNGEVVAVGPGNATAALSTTGVTPGTYANANVQIDSKGRIVAASPGVSPFGMVENFETWSGGLPNTLPWTSGQAAQISQSALHVTSGTSSCQFSAVGVVTMSATVAAAFLANFGELVVDVYVGTMAGGQRATISCGANSASTPNGATGTFTLRVAVPVGATTISLAVSGASTVWWDNLRYVVRNSAVGTSYDNTTSGLAATNVQTAIDEIVDELGTAADKDVGVAIGNVVQLANVGGVAGLPAVDGSQLTGVSSVISTQTAPVGGVASMVFTLGNELVYDFDLVDVCPETDDADLYVQLSTDAGATWMSSYNYTDDWVRSDLATKPAPRQSNAASNIVLSTANDGWSNALAEAISGIVRIYKPSGAIKRKQVTWQISGQQQAGGQAHIVGAGETVVATAVNRIRFIFSSGDIAEGSIIRQRRG